MLVHLVESLPLDGSDPLENYRTIRRELELYNPKLAAKRELVAVSKCELTDTGPLRDQLAAALGQPVLVISAVTGEGLPELIRAIAAALAEAAA